MPRWLNGSQEFGAVRRTVGVLDELLPGSWTEKSDTNLRVAVHDGTRTPTQRPHKRGGEHSGRNENALLLRLELGLCEHACVPELAKLRELVEDRDTSSGGRRGRDRRRKRRNCCSRSGGSCVLRGPPLLLTSVGIPDDPCCDGCTRGGAEKTHDWFPSFSVRSSSAMSTPPENSSTPPTADQAPAASASERSS